MHLTNPALTADPDHVSVCAAEPAQPGQPPDEPQRSSSTATALKIFIIY